MRTSRTRARLAAAGAAATALVALSATAALAHPPSEGEHPGGCVVTAEPGTIPVGGQFTVEGNFGGASIYVLPGRNASPGETAEPDATTPPGSSFSVTFTHEGSAGDLSVVAVIEASECGDTDHVTVTGAALPDTATEGPTDTVLALTAALFLGSAAIAGRRVLRRG